MKPGYEKIVSSPVSSFLAREIIRESRPLLSQAWHFHPELEICYTSKSAGKRFVGNMISDYQEDDLVMFGSNLPHGFTTDMYCSQVVLQMNYDFLGHEFINRPELKVVKKLFHKSKHGLDFGPETKKQAIPLIAQLVNEKDTYSQLLRLLELLRLLAHTEDVKNICSTEYALSLNESQLDRIKIVYDHIMYNFRDDVSVKEISDKLNISEAGFYKLIKKQTKKTYTQIINEFRISHASKLLMNSDKSISQICFESGYNNISYFNRKFKEIMHQTPKAFKVKYDDSFSE